jgi:hypothetical protein
MATLTYAYDHACSNGGHVSFTVSLNGGAAQTFNVTTDEFLVPLGQLTTEERSAFAITLLKIREAGKTRAQMKTDLQTGFTVTI